MANPVILITGAHGQLGNELRTLAPLFPSFQFLYTDKDDLPLTDAALIDAFFIKHRPAWCINCAAYTAVDKAETEKEIAFAVNADAVGILAAACKMYTTRFIHISTDYVFDGNSPVPYTEESPVSPVNVYGASKLKGEELCRQRKKDSVIIRTAWVYSEFGNNFVKTMLRLMKERPEISVVNDQVGAPTYAADLAACIMKIVNDCHSYNSREPFADWKPGTYHYSNQGRISWYDFAVAIKELTSSPCIVHPITSDKYPTAAKRPSFSLLDTHKIQSTYHCTIPGWRDALVRCLQHLSK